MSELIESLYSSASSSSCMVRVIGPDPHRRKMISTAFHQLNSGQTTLAASGILLYNKQNEIQIIMNGDIIVPFLIAEEGIAAGRLLANTKIEILLQPNIPDDQNEANNNSKNTADNSWIGCSLLRIGILDSVNSAVNQLIGNSSEFDLGWSIAPPNPQLINLNTSTQHNVDSLQMHPTSTAHPSHRHLHYSNGIRRSAGILAVVKPIKSNKLRMHTIQPLQLNSMHNLSRGSTVTVVSSPYGLLSPHVFHNSLTRGVIANFIQKPFESQASIRAAQPNFVPQSPAVCSLALIDARCLPGSEGAAVLDSKGKLVGLVTIPLRHTNYASPIEFNSVISVDTVISWLNSQPNTAINMNTHSFNSATKGNSQLHSASTAACFKHQAINRIGQQLAFLNPNIGAKSRKTHSSSVEEELNVVAEAERSLVVCSVALSWASAIVLTSSGYILTNAHLLRPYLQSVVMADSNNIHSTTPALSSRVTVRLEPCHIQPMDGDYEADQHTIRADSKNNSIWCDAKLIFISTGPWDIALLKIDSPYQLYPAKFPSFSSLNRVGAPIGSSVLVIGHALFHPRANISPSLSKGVLSRIVQLRLNSSNELEPVLLQSDAAVHNGNSGGMLVNESTGELLGMVTSNVAHTAIWPHCLPDYSVAHSINNNSDDKATASSSASIIPHLNFSIPVYQLAPLLSYAQSEGNNQQGLTAINQSSDNVGKIWRLEELVPSPQPKLPISEKYELILQQIQQQINEADEIVK
jgi:S1-C subfamily serine protease